MAGNWVALPVSPTPRHTMAVTHAACASSVDSNCCCSPFLLARSSPRLGSSACFDVDLKLAVYCSTPAESSPR